MDSSQPSVFGQRRVESRKTLFSVLCLLVALVPFVSYWVYHVLHRTMPAGLADADTVRWLDEMGRIARKGSVLLHDFGLELGIEPIKLLLNTAFSYLFNPLFYQRVDYRDMIVSQDLYSGVPVSTYTPLALVPNLGCYPTIVYFHGGGWTWLSVGVYDGPLKHFAKATQFKIVAVEYRKAPQYPFPAAYDDCLAVTKYVISNARDLHVCNDMVIIAGDGAGGNLAAAVANEMSSLIRMQILINPALQMMNFATPSYQDFGNDSLLPGITSSEKEISNWIRYGDINPDLAPLLSNNTHISLHHYNFLSSYIDSHKRLPVDLNVTQTHTIHNTERNENLPSQLDELVLDSRFCPMFTSDVRNLAHTYIITSQYDVLRDEGIMYANRLKESGVKVNLAHYWHGFHGFFLFAGGGWIELSESKKAMDDLVKYLHTNILRSPAVAA
ncbi:neutral cholesterol ester hydrolase 1-like [Plakobranchus ocellatus]|uniref:Neutral cholesterol ester hydrolase 1-like n=1 Tax=Plakobranchus ocellatus TaxID=259542 RepID=A0AAV4DHK0_9GAST|nr:neutral cholesterol ester hydrolase 1-like [Plakobranchus ocellatus]